MVISLDKIKRANRVFRLFLIAIVLTLLSLQYVPVYIPEVYAVFKGLFELDMNYIFDGLPFEPSDFANVKIK